MERANKRIAIIGGGPSALFMFKRLIESGRNELEVEIFERKKQLGAGMPYSNEGANKEHITNVSGNEIPQIVTSIHEWVCTVNAAVLAPYNITPENFNDYKVLPRLLFGEYLSAQFDLLQDMAQDAGIIAKIHKGIDVSDVIDKPELNQVWVEFEGSAIVEFDEVIICTGHNWPKKNEGKTEGYFDSPYPPSKLELYCNNAVAIRGSSLTAIDAIRTLARSNGSFREDANGMLSYKANEENPDFRMVMHTRNGLLPAVRFHLEDSHLQNKSLLTPEEIEEHRLQNDGFLSLDFIFEKDFKDLFKENHADFYELIKDMQIEEFVDAMMDLRESTEPFTLLREEYYEAEKSIKKRESVYWKEALAILSFAMNYPAKHLSAEDMLRLQKTLMPLISIVIAFVPQTSCKELLALYDAGKLDIIKVDAESTVEPEAAGGATYNYKDENGDEQSVYYKVFVDCIGQPHLLYEDFPFKTMIEDKAISPAMLAFRSAQQGCISSQEGNKKVVKINEDYYLEVPGITINDNFQVVDRNDNPNPRIYIMAVPYIGGYNPDYSGLDFGEAASLKIINGILQPITV
ncbi:hypothetical protein Q765_19350 [Flavobacterium rivuli WB 3.3-2 = DSM 21788]|uniref:FAD-dependent urate hydroxylase HpyO/Asp monooxygenase CreE-like FAD/NAD(P)-binding domain-containing protein n=1 Tax=Flavobacterium rivuli WB 3.3-2 = DSM 21788 TaxID=1121895 RepID=A0A0A2LXY4_9FLAO|nr:FAD/NAD(P)-binding protein [Flavobacterium rivuli]KGO84869.1 hypothetical protein Q765_19350 [Flavobacterium rivuli WB 3.3-2 = DSM 21788]